MSTTPAEWAGAVTLSWVADSTVSAVPAVVPNRTLVAPVRFAPVTVTTVPPTNGPATGDTADTTGAEAATATGVPATIVVKATRQATDRRAEWRRNLGAPTTRLPL